MAALPESSPSSSRSPTGCFPARKTASQSAWSSSMEELQAFYDAAFGRLEDGAEYLRGVACIEGISEEDRNLLWLSRPLSPCRSPSRCGARPGFPTVAHRPSM